MKMSLVQKSQAQFWKTRFQRGYRRRGSLSLAAAGGLACARASCRPMASAIRRMRGSRGSPVCGPLSLTGQGPFRPSSFAMPSLPRQGPSDENSQEFHDGSQKFESSTCGVEMLAGGGYSLWNRVLPPNDHALGRKCSAAPSPDFPQLTAAILLSGSRCLGFQPRLRHALSPLSYWSRAKDQARPQWYLRK